MYSFVINGLDVIPGEDPEPILTLPQALFNGSRVLRPGMTSILFLFLLQACSGSVNAYKTIGNDLKKNYNLSRGDLIVNYDLAKMDNRTCIYSKDLGLILNDKNHTKKYIYRFKNNFKSSETLKHEAKKQVARISNLLMNLHNQHKILSNSQYSYVKNLNKPTKHPSETSREDLAKLDDILSTIPVMIPEYNPIISSYYGNRYHPIQKKTMFHYGTDLVGHKSAKIYTAANGKVVFVGKKTGYGYVVEVKHSNNIKTLYAHLSKSLVKKGASVHRGKAIGIQGHSGSVTGDHLHFEILINDKHINPYDFIKHACSC